MSDFKDSTNFAKIKLKTNDNENLCIFLYFDDWGAVNPLGIYAKRRKVSAFYYTIGNLVLSNHGTIIIIYIISQEICRVNIDRQFTLFGC